MAEERGLSVEEILEATAAADMALACKPSMAVRLGMDRVKAPQDRFMAIMSEPYDPDLDLSTLVGRPSIDVIMINLRQQALEGRLAAITQVLDRYMGKPHQSIETVNVSGSISEWHSIWQREREDISAAMEEARRLEASRWQETNEVIDVECTKSDRPADV